jgi:hypothetical protein
VLYAIAIAAVAVFLSGAVFGALVLLVAGIHSGSRRRRLARRPRNRIEAAARRVLVRVRDGEREED